MAGARSSFGPISRRGPAARTARSSSTTVGGHADDPLPGESQKKFRQAVDTAAARSTHLQTHTGGAGAAPLIHSPKGEEQWERVASPGVNPGMQSRCVDFLWGSRDEASREASNGDGQECRITAARTRAPAVAAVTFRAQAR